MLGEGDAQLDEAGASWVAVELPLTSFEDDVAATRQVIDGVDGPVVLCGHSYGGAVITEAGDQPQRRAPRLPRGLRLRHG